jgi:signal transduction histidine kinase
MNIYCNRLVKYLNQSFYYSSYIRRCNQDKIKDNLDRICVPNKEDIQIAISDLDKGISTKIMPRIFEKFVSYSESGTGLGLYITRKLVEAHGGKIWAENNKDGKGATFSFSIPSNK